MSRAVFLFALLAVATAESPQRFRSRAAFVAQRPNARLARLEEPQEQPQQPQEVSTGYQYPKPMSSGYQYPKPDQAFPLPGEGASETTTIAGQEEQVTATESAPTTTAAYEDYEDSTGALEPAPVDTRSNAKLRRRPQQLTSPSPIRLTLANYRQPQVAARLQERNPSAATGDEALRPIYVINLPDSALQRLVLLNSAQQQLQLAPQPIPTVYLSELDYVYKKK